MALVQLSHRVVQPAHYLGALCQQTYGEKHGSILKSVKLTHHLEL